jgi:hypothetical protein
MALHPSTFDYLQPTLEQVADMQSAREAGRDYANAINMVVPDGPDKTYILRKLREVAMWVNVAITRNPDGSPRQGREVDPGDYPVDHPVKGDLGSIPL